MKCWRKCATCRWRKLSGGGASALSSVWGGRATHHRAGGGGVEKAPVSAGLLWFSLLQPRACVRGIKLGRQAAKTLWSLVLPARGFWGLKCLSHVLWPFVFRNGNLQKEMGKCSYCIIHKACCLLQFSPTESSSIPWEVLPVSLIRLIPQRMFSKLWTLYMRNLSCILPPTHSSFFFSKELGNRMKGNSVLASWILSHFKWLLK